MVLWKRYAIFVVAFILFLVAFYSWWFLQERSGSEKLFLLAVFVLTVVAFLYVTLHEIGKASREHDRYLAHGEETPRPPPATLRQSEIQVEHREAESEHDAWLQDATMWHRNHELAKPMLERIEQAIAESEHRLDEHVTAIRHHQALMKKHELAIAEHAAAGEDQERGQWLAEHQDEERIHVAERAKHQRLAEDHGRLMSGLGQLVQGLGASA
jgi:hypothetical protein